jgi:hypothetical protein
MSANHVLPAQQGKQGTSISVIFIFTLGLGGNFTRAPTPTVHTHDHSFGTVMEGRAMISDTSGSSETRVMLLSAAKASSSTTPNQ